MNEKCKHKGCKRVSAYHRRECEVCKLKNWRARNPIRYAYQTTKTNAKRRKKYFGISFEDFTFFCIDTNYIELKGIYRHSMTIDRKRSDLGYIKGNLQLLANGKNVQKMNEERALEKKYGESWRMMISKQDENYVPF